MSASIHALRAPTPEPAPSAYGRPLSPEAKAAISTILAEAKRLQTHTSGGYITEASLAALPDLLTNIARQSLKAGQAIRGRKS